MTFKAECIQPLGVILPMPDAVSTWGQIRCLQRESEEDAPSEAFNHIGTWELSRQLPRVLG